MTLPDAPKHKWHENPYDDRPRYDDPYHRLRQKGVPIFGFHVSAANIALAAISRRFTEDMDEIARGTKKDRP